MYSYLMIQNIKEKDRKNIEYNLELKKLNECLQNNKINTLNKTDCHKLFYNYIKCNEIIQIKRYIKYSTSGPK